MRFVIATLAIAVSDLILLVAFAGIGLSVRRLNGLRSASLADCLVAFWVGFALVVLVLMSAHFFVPIGDWALPTVLLAGAVSLWLSRDALGALLREVSRGDVIWLAAAGLIVLWVANASLGPLANWDSALYHLQAIRWTERFALVPGIANLYGPLAFNNASFLYGALVNSGPWQDRGYHLANGVLVIATLLQGLVALRSVLRTEGPRFATSLVTVLLATPAVVLVFPETLPSYITDAPTTLVLLAVIPLVTLELAGEGSWPERSYRVLVITVLLALAVCMKLHAAVFAALAWPLVVGHWLLHARSVRGTWRKTLGLSCAVVIVFASVWMGRGVVQSGYPFFPVARLGLPVDWRAPAEHAAAEQAFILHSARNSSARLGIDPGMERLRVWLPRWWRTEGRRHPYELIVPVVLLIVSGGAHLLPRVRARSPATLALLVPIAGALVAWFVSGPAPRYAMYLVWAAAALVVTAAIGPWAVRSPGRRRLSAALGATLAVSPAVVFPMVQAARVGGDPLLNIVRQNLNRPPDGALVPSLERHEYTVFTTESGLVLNVPALEYGGRCWEIALPCTPNPAPNLMLRSPGRLGDGFKVEGAWAMRDWPNNWLPQFLDSWRRTRGE